MFIVFQFNFWIWILYNLYSLIDNMGILSYDRKRQCKITHGKL